MNWLRHLFGLDSASGQAYLALSGALSDLGELAIIGGLVTLYRKHNCHQRHCWRLGRYPAAGGQFVTCRHHHPDPVIRAGVTARHLLAAHRAHQAAKEAHGDHRRR